MPLLCRKEGKKNPKLLGNKLGKTWLLACSSHHSWLIKISIVAGYEIHRRLVRQDMPWQNNIGLNSPSVMVAFSPGFISCCPITQHHFCHKTKKEYMKKVMRGTDNLNRFFWRAVRDREILSIEESKLPRAQEQFVTWVYHHIHEMILTWNCAFLKWVCDKKIIAYTSHNPLFSENIQKTPQKPSFRPWNGLFWYFCIKNVYVEKAIWSGK